MTPSLDQATSLQWPTVTAIQRVKSGGSCHAAIAASNNEVQVVRLIAAVSSAASSVSIPRMRATRSHNPKELASPLREPVVTLEQVRTVQPRPPISER